MDPLPAEPTAAPAPRRPRARRLLWGVWSVAALTLLILHLQPISTGVVRAAEAAALATMGLLPVWAWRRHGAIRLAALTAGLLVAAAALWPAPARASGKLRASYLQRLQSYEGTRYVWGGEGWTGIDCSGLVRRAMVDALRTEALQTANPAVLRQSIALWWHDRSAKALGEGFRGDTRLVTRAASLNTIDVSRLRPGDLAVTADGKHVLAYAGDRTWIAADWPIVDRWRIPERRNKWFRVPVRIVRWRWLDDAAAR